MGVIRKTKSVKAVLHIFEQQQYAISVVDLIERLQDDMNKTTVYRILDRLEQDAVVHSFMGKDGLKWYAKCLPECSTGRHLDAHPHFQCNQCGKMTCLSVDIHIPEIKNYQIESAVMLLVGRCEDCQ